MRRPSITVNKSSFLGRGQIIPPNNCPPFGRKLIGSHENPETEDPMYVRWEEKQYKEEDEPNLQVESKERTVHSWQVPSHPKLAIIRRILEGGGPSGSSTSTRISEIPTMHCEAMQLQPLLSCGVCFGRLLSKELNRSKQLEGGEVLDTASLPRWDHRSGWYREALIDNISGLTDRGVRLNGWGPLEEHGEGARIE